MEPLHVEFPVGTAKGAKSFPTALDLLALYEGNAVLSNWSDTFTLPTPVHILEQIYLRSVSLYDLHGTHIDVPPYR